MALLFSTTIVVMMVGGSWLAAHYLMGLPWAPDCPSCRSVTAAVSRTTAVDRVLAQAGGAVARCCPRCGWSGRMRWRLAQERAVRK